MKRLIELIREAKSLIVWMKAMEYPTCKQCVYYTSNDQRCDMLERFMHENEYCSKWDEKE